MNQNLASRIREKLFSTPEKRKILTNISWLMGDKGITLALSLLLSVLLARYLGPEQFGVYNYALAFVSIFQILSSLGLNGIVVRDLVELPNQDKEILGTSFVLRFLGSLLSIVVTIIIVTLFDHTDKQILPLILLLSLSNVASAFQTVSFYFESKVLSKYVVKAHLLSQISYYILLAILIFSEASLTFIAITFVFQSVVNALLLCFMYSAQKQQIFAWKFRWNRAKSLLSRSWPLILSSFGAIIYLKIDQIMLGQMTSNTEVGVYSVAVRFSEVWYFIPNLIVASYFPSLLKSREKSYQEYNTRIQKLYDLLMLGALGLSIAMTFLSSPLINSLYGQYYQNSAIILSIHIWASIFIFMRALLSKWLIAEDLYIFSFVTHSSGAIVNLILNLFLIPSFGGIGAAIATVISYSVASYVSLFFHPRTIISGKMMTIALLSPIRYIIKHY
ncbi:flippase [Geminocystis sp. CENA526]|uniref:flippase n=1 Tax=Geminocystis sp. CENA526 TaxID=1355871 RepID=UPI003D7001AD